MSEMMWKVGEGKPYIAFIVAQDEKFQMAMRQELRDMAADRGLKLRETPALPKTKEKNPELRMTVVPKRVGHNRDFILVSTNNGSKGGVWKVLQHEQIIRECADKYRVSIQELIGARREKAMVKARFEAYHRMSDELGYSLPMIGKACGGKDHTSVLHGIRKYRKGLEQASMEKAA